MKNKIRNLQGRTKVLLVIAAVVLLFTGLSIMQRWPKIGPIQDVETFYLEYSAVDDQNYITGYGFKKEEDGTYAATIQTANGNYLQREYRDFTVDEAFVQQVEDLLVKHHVRWWKGIYPSATRSSTGLLKNNPYTGLFSVTTANGEGMHSWIYSKGPWNFQKVWRGVEEIFAELT